MPQSMANNIMTGAAGCVAGKPTQPVDDAVGLAGSEANDVGDRSSGID